MSEQLARMARADLLAQQRATEELRRILSGQSRDVGGSPGQGIVPQPDAVEGADGKVQQANTDVDPLERWRRQTYEMLGSSSPVVRKMGKDTFNQYNQRATQIPTDTRSVAAKMSQEAGNVPGSPEDKAFIQAYAFKSSRNPNTISVTDAKSLEWLDDFKPENENDQTLVGREWSEVAGKVKAIDPKSKREEMSGLAVWQEAQDQLFGEDGIFTNQGNDFASRIKQGGTALIQQFAQTDPRYKTYYDFKEGFTVALAKAMGESGNLSNQDVQRAARLLPITLSLNPDSPEVARRKLDVLYQIIKAGDEGDPEEAKRLARNASKLLAPKSKTGDFYFGEIYSLDGEIMRYVGGSGSDPSLESNWEEVY